MRGREGPLHRMVSAEALDGRDVTPFDERREHEAARHRRPVHEDRASAAHSDAARLTDARQSELTAQDGEQ